MSRRIETELKFKVEGSVTDLFQKIEGVKPEVFYIKDEIYGHKGELDNNPKIRKRIKITSRGIIKKNYEKVAHLKGEGINKMLEEKKEEMLKDYKLENSYEKIRYLFYRPGYEITIDFYPIGIFCEIEGKEKKIKKVARKLGFDLKDNIKENIDAYYCRWAEKENKKPLLHWGFGKLFPTV